MKDHEIAAIVNKARDIAVKYGQTQQLRAHLSELLVPLFASPHIAESAGEAPIGYVADAGMMHLQSGGDGAWARVEAARSTLFRVPLFAAPGPKVREPLTEAETNEALMTATFGAPPTEGPSAPSDGELYARHSKLKAPPALNAEVDALIGYMCPECPETHGCYNCQPPKEAGAAEPTERFEMRRYDFAGDGNWMAWQECSESDYLHYDGRRADVQVRKVGEAAPPATAPGEVELPPLPEPSLRELKRGYVGTQWVSGNPDYFTAHQMIAFGRACIAAAKGKA